MIKRTLDSK